MVEHGAVGYRAYRLHGGHRVDRPTPASERRAMCGRELKPLPDVVDGRTDVEVVVCAICDERVERAARERWS